MAAASTPRRPWLVPLADFRPDGGFGYLAPLPDHFPPGDASDQPTQSLLVLLEDGVPLGPRHAVHDDIRKLGLGRYSHWNRSLRFSTSDNSDPRTGKRQFHAYVPAAEHGERSAKAAVLEAFAGLEESFTPAEAYAAVDQGLRLLYPAEILDGSDRESIAIAAARYRDELAEMKTSDILFLSIPKSGRTWIRFFLQEYILAATGKSVDSKPRGIPRTECTRAMLFTHGYFAAFEGLPGSPTRLFEDEFGRHPLVLLTRDPRDVVLSYYHFTCKRDPAGLARWVPSGSFGDFVDSQVYGLERISRAHEIGLEIFERHAGPKHLLRYEDCLANPAESFEALLRFSCTAPVDRAAFDRALAKSSFKEMQALEMEISRGKVAEVGRLGVAGWTGNVNELMVRSGKARGFLALRPDLDDASVLERRYPITARVLEPALRGNR